MKSSVKKYTLWSFLGAALLCSGTLVIQSVCAQSSHAASPTEYPVIARATDIQDVFLQKALLDFIEITKAVNRDDPKALFEASLASERICANFEGFKVQHTRHVADQVRNPIREAYQVAVNNLKWAQSSDDADLQNYFKCIMKISQKMELHLVLQPQPSLPNSRSGSEIESSGSSGSSRR